MIDNIKQARRLIREARERLTEVQTEAKEGGAKELSETMRLAALEANGVSASLSQIIEKMEDQ